MKNLLEPILRDVIVYILFISFFCSSSQVFASGALGGKTSGQATEPAFASGLNKNLSGVPGRDLKQVGKSFLEQGQAMCGQDCLYHKATSNITYQMDWVQTKLNELNRIKNSGGSNTVQKMNKITNNFCNKLGLEVYRISHPTSSKTSLDPEQCYKTYLTFMENWLWKARASLAENESQIRSLKCDSGEGKSAHRKQCDDLLTADLEELYQLSSSARLTQVPEFMTAAEISDFNEKYSDKKSLAKLYEVTGEEYENITAVDYVKQKLVLKEADCNVLRKSARNYKNTEGSSIKNPDDAIFKACQDSKKNLESLLSLKEGTSSTSSSPSEGIKLKDLVEEDHKKIARAFKADVEEDHRSALRKLYDDHHDESVISVMGAIDQKAKKSWINVTQVPDDDPALEGSTGSGEKKARVELQEIDVAKARKDLGKKAGELKTSPPVFIRVGGQRNRGESAVIQRTMQSGQVELDENKSVRPVNENRLIHKLDQVSGHE